MSTPIRQLLEVITKSVEALETACQSSGVTLPDLNQPLAGPGDPSERFRAIPQAAEAARVISAAALQLEAILTPPQVSLYHIVSGHFKSAALQVCHESNVTEILREGGAGGTDVKIIAEKNGQDPEKLARFLRYLATHHIYREVKPNVFANNRISSMLDTGKPSKVIIASPEEKHTSPGNPLAALVSHHLDEAFKASAYAWDTVKDAAQARSGDPTASPFAKAMGRPETLWDYYASKDEKISKEAAFKGRRFDIAMQGISSLQPPDAILNAYEWKTLPADSLVVDVGGGVGTSCLGLARAFPSFKLVVQDLEGVIDQGKTVWKKEMPNAVPSGQVKLEVHDFFKPQPQTSATMFLLKQIMHDWSDEYCVKILTQLWEAATPTTTLLILDSIMPLACRDENSAGLDGIPGATSDEAPAPLLANYGGANDMVYNADFTMFLLFNSQERTLEHIKRLLKRTGWHLMAVHRQPGDSTFLQSIEAKKIVANADV
ncbi:S-adenosyl-L-methionine-dependent methyltransferase [Mycena belliarum]|uniref:S-adenosyl-L-methionine-dependent methyltransferase n=1 Tax=Mycena belliarum TaxID=1033014 RepID=A0AAD6UL71_9AGAR|nr:S-adenosyl-L-methionine-dependent methyltransferase [Mycena belliae]